MITAECDASVLPAAMLLPSTPTAAESYRRGFDAMLSELAHDEVADVAVFLQRHRHVFSLAIIGGAKCVLGVPGDVNACTRVIERMVRRGFRDNDVAAFGAHVRTCDEFMHFVGAVRLPIDAMADVDVGFEALRVVRAWAREKEAMFATGAGEEVVT